MDSSVLKKVAEIQKNLLGIKKDKDGHNYRYVTLNKILVELEPFLKEHNLTILNEVEKNESGTLLRTTLMDDESKYSVSCPIMGLEGLLNGKTNLMQAMGAAITYCRRYNLINIFNLFATDDDAEILTVDRQADSKQVQEIKNLLEMVKKKDDKFKESAFYEFVGSTDINQISEAKAKQAITALKGKLK